MTKSHTRKTLPFLCAAVGVLSGILMGVPALAAQPEGPSDVVGEVTAVIGLGKVLNAQGEHSAVRGQLIHAGDKIETPAGGHVHVRFVDGGLVSVRPLSRLHIEDYRNQGAQNLAAIKFRLDVGAMRSVTGQWGEAHRDRFRLNTPVAAIGIKGTDFVVKAENGSTLVSVKTGAIVMAPLEGACAAALGTCSGERSVLLSADMPGQMLEYLKQNDKSAPRLVPYVDLLARNNSPIQTAQQRPAEASGPVEVVSKDLDKQVKEAVAGSPPARAQLVWLHNALDWNVPAHTISTRFDEASAAGRRPVIGNFFISLYRDETTRKDFAPTVPVADFALQNASANYVQAGGAVEQVSVSGAKLSVDFARNTLATQMDLASPSMGKDRFASAATITPEGAFANNTASQKLAGAFSTSAGQAGYQFEKQLSGGTVSGLTLWGR